MSEKKLTKSQLNKIRLLTTKSAKIRFLTGLEWSRVEIAEYLEIRYQHVRNVQITPVGDMAKRLKQAHDEVAEALDDSDN